MATYAALLSLTESLNEILNLQQFIHPPHKELIVSLHRKVNFIVTFLEDYSDKYCGTLDRVGNRFRKAAYEAQDFMDSYLCSFSRINYDCSSSWANSDRVKLDPDLKKASQRIKFIWKEVKKIKNCDIAEDLRHITHSSPVDHSSGVKITAKNMFVGCDDDLNSIKERLYEDSYKLQIIPIVGMGGIGKTTLARRAYEDSLLAQYFDICSWITVSSQYQRREILSRLLQSFEKTDSEQSDKSDPQLAKLIHQQLMGRRYLIVIDDIWSTKAWDDLKMIFPDDDRGSRILLTTRLSDVAIYAGSSNTPFHQMNFLNGYQSWKLLQERIYGQESCPIHLVEIGKKIARNCGGLPLTIVVVAGLLLSTGNMAREELWGIILKNISSTERTIALQCSKILCLSYDQLPLRLKPCFLYITAFPEDSEIDVSKLIKLWVAEGFLKPGDESKCLEDVGEQYLQDLVNRSLILVRKKGQNGKVETVGIHDLLREICITKAEEEGFLHHVSSKKNAQKDTVGIPNRRLSIHFRLTFPGWQILDSSVRSVLFVYERHFPSKLSLSCRRLSILDAPKVTWRNFSDVISTLVNLRYIAFSLNSGSCPLGFPASISKLPNLQTIIAHVNYSRRDSLLQLPYDILEMPKLRHLIMTIPFCLTNPSNIGIVRESDVQTLETVINFRFTENSIKILANLKKLNVFFYMSHDDFNLDNLCRLQNLKELHVSVSCCLSVRPMIWNHAFPISLKKLTLKEVSFLWENMSMIGSLPNLQVLEMLNIKTTKASKWMLIEGQFLQLKYFCSSLDYLVKWEVEKEHFPSLESLILHQAEWIDEIPCSVGEIDSLQLIELNHCSRSLVNSARRIQEQQLKLGNDAFKVRVIGY